MPKKIRDTAEFKFIEAVASGTVHIVVEYAVWDDPHEDTREQVSFAEGLYGMFTGPTIVLCGAKTYPVQEKTHHYTNCFPDQQLCANCRRMLHDDDIERAFRHPQPDDDPAE